MTTSECGVAACADSYLGDLAKSLNTLDDPLTGCSSGVKVMCCVCLMILELKWLFIQDYFYEQNLLIPKALDNTVRYCLHQVGFGCM